MFNIVYSIIIKGYNMIDIYIINSSRDFNNQRKSFFLSKLLGRFILFGISLQTLVPFISKYLLDIVFQIFL